MANVVIANNGSEAKKELRDELGAKLQDAKAADDSLVVIDENGKEIIIPPGVSVGLPNGTYTIRVA